ncbi:MAG: Zeta toxin family protein [Gammaproteobacteria bacterium]|nr:MAG: Zeta toxin family protein [Gammaproteobacteria bacterium]RKZ71526.1 MAG: Zeta toxin family protein [Gammaproteobacteria bacterium]
MKCYIIAGPNGAGKTTFAKKFLPEEASCLNYVNADLIAEGLSPFKPESVAFEAGKLLLKKLDDMVRRKKSFSFETTLSGLNYVRRIKRWQNQGYEVILFFLKLSNEEMAINRVKLRVSEGGHNIPKEVIKRRFNKGWYNFQNHYKYCVDAWVIFDNSGESPILLKESL